MPNITIELDWHLYLNTAELRLVLMALGGRLKPGDIEAANELGDQLTILRNTNTKNLIQQAEHNLSRVEAKLAK